MSHFLQRVGAYYISHKYLVRPMINIVSPPCHYVSKQDGKLNETVINKLKKYGNTFTDFDKEQCRITTWKTGGWRPVEDGISGGTTEGDFILNWDKNKHYSSNAGVKDGDYINAFRDTYSLLNHISSSKNVLQRKKGKAYCANEINYHDDGSQLFISLDNWFMLLVAKPKKNPDDVKPSDFECFVIPSGVGVNVDAGVWHCAPIAYNYTKKVRMKTRQGKVHSKIYYDPVKEDNVIFEIPCME